MSDEAKSSEESPSTTDDQKPEKAKVRPKGQGSTFAQRGVEVKK